MKREKILTLGLALATGVLVTRYPNPLKTDYFVSKEGHCYSLASVDGKIHSHDYVPCTDKVIESVPPEQRPNAREIVPTRPVAAQTAPFPFQLNSVFR